MDQKFTMRKWSCRLFMLALISFSVWAKPAKAQVDVTSTGGTPAASYTNLSSAFTAINNGVHTGSISVGISASFTDAAPAVLNSSGAGAASYTDINVHPTVDGVTMSFATASGRGVIELNGADNVTIDGDNPMSMGTNQNLTIVNTAANTVTFTSVIRLATSSLVTSCNGITIRNCVLTGSGTNMNAAAVTTETVTWGIVATNGASTTAATNAPSALSSATSTSGATETMSNLLIENNNIQSVSRGISLNGGSGTMFANALITGNLIGNPTQGNINQVTGVGITINGTANGIVRSNTVYVEGYLASSTPNKAINIGMISTTGLTNVTVERNIIGRMMNNNTGTWTAQGITISGGSNHIIRNNFINNVTCIMGGSGAFSNQFTAFAVYISGGTGHRLYYNTIHNNTALSGAGGTSNASIGCLGITSTSITGCDVRNNIFAMQATGGSTNQARYCIFLPSGATSAMNLTLNNNVYYAPAGNLIAQVGTVFGTGTYTAANFNASVTTPAANLRAYTSTLSTAGTNDNASMASTAAAPFVSSTDLHINNVAPNVLDVESKGTPIAGVTSDFDGAVRNVTTPDIGADEFDLSPCAGAIGGTATPSSASICSGQTTPISTTGATIGSGITYQWEVSTVGGGVGFANVTGGTGATTMAYTTSNALAPGTYYFRLNVTCSLGPVTAYSNEVAVTVNALPTVSITPSSAQKCETDATPVALTASGAVTYTWSPAGGLSATTGASVNATNTMTTTYTATGTDVNGCVNTAMVTVTIDKMPSAPVVTPASPSICGGGNINLNATASYPGGIGVIGTGTSTTTQNATASSDYPNPLHHYYGGNKHQMLIRASELTAMGLSAGNNITAIAFPVATVNTTEALNSYMVRVGHTALATISTFQTGLTTVRNAANYTPATTGFNTITFDVPFTWNGTDNIIIETSFSNNDAPSTGNNTMTFGTTAYQSTIVYRVDNQPGATVNAHTGTVTYTYSARPNIRFTWVNPTVIPGSDIHWSPAAGLSATTGNMVNASPTSTSTYAVTAVNGLCTSAATNVTVNVGTPLVCTGITAPGGLVCAGVSFNLTLNTTGGGAPFTYVWSDGVGGVYPDAASINPNLPAGTYNFSVMVTDNCMNTCTSNVTVVVSPNGGSITGPATGLTYQNLTYVASGYPAGATFQWQSATTSGGPYTNIPGATDDSLVASTNAGGTYYIVCVITSPGGCITTTNQVTTVVTVAGDNACSAVPLNPGINGPFTNTGATLQTGEVAPPNASCTGQVSWCNTPSNTVWFSFVAPASGKASVHIIPNNWDSEIAVWSASSCGALTGTGATMIAANDDSTGSAPYSSWIAPMCLIPGNTYYVQIDGYGATTNSNFQVFLKTNYTNDAPVIAGTPSNIIMSNDAGVCGAVVTWTLPTMSDADNCIPSLTSFTSTHNSGDLFPIGTTTVTYTAMDGVNTTTSSFDVTVNDTELPVITGTPTSITIAANAAGCTAVVTWSAPTATDNCSSALTSTHNSGDTFPQGTTTVTYTAADPSGNEVTSTFDVTVTTDLLATLDASSDVNCNGGNDGSVDVTTTGMSTPYTFDWNSGAFNTEDLSGITAGSYQLIASDALGCTDTVALAIAEPAAITGSQTMTICDGESITVGTSTYNTSGTYTDVLTAANGCDSTVTTNLTVNAPVNTGTSTSLVTITASSATGTYQWIDCATMLPIAGETSQSFTATADGDYAVIVTESGCSDTTACVNITGTGIQGFGGFSFSLYPNPTSGIYTIVSTINGQMTLVNALGDVVSTGKLNKGANQFDAASIARGVYMVRLSDVNGNLLHTQRLTITK